MLNLQFSNVLNYDLLLTEHREQAKNPGFFILGFMHPNKNKFIPFQIGSSQRSILSQIRNEYKQIVAFNSTRLRPSWDYIFGETPFYIDPCFPVLTKRNNFNKIKLPEWFIDYYPYFIENRRFYYINNREFISTELLRLETETDSLEIVENEDREIEVSGNIEIPEEYLKKNNYPVNILRDAYFNKGLEWHDEFLFITKENLWLTYSIIDKAFFESNECRNYFSYLSNAPFNIKKDKYKSLVFDTVKSFLNYKLKGKTTQVSMPWIEFYKHNKRLKIKIEFNQKNLESYLCKTKVSNEYNGY